MPQPAIPATVALKPPAELVSFVERQIRDARSYVGLERRSERRYLMAVPLWVQPVDGQFKAIGPPFAAVTRDISPKGIGLVHTQPIDPQLLALRMSLADEEVILAAEVVWCRPLGPFYYIGGEFFAKLESFPRSSAESSSDRS